MNLNQTGKLLCDLRKSKGMTQKQVAEAIGVMPKTVSKWETGHGFPDVSLLAELADILGVSERVLLSGNLTPNKCDAGNVKKTKFYVCPFCGSTAQTTGECLVICCGKQQEALKPNEPDKKHRIDVSIVENDFYIELNHEMEKDHYISFVAFVGFDRTLMVRLYPQQDATVRIPRMQRGRIYCYCTKHGLFEFVI